MPQVSVVVPTINRPGLVTRAVRSVLAQTFRDIEVLVVVDGPDAPTAAALGRVCDARLRTLHLAGSRGYGGAVNAGVEQARGRWVAFLDDDDEWLPGKLEAQLEHARRSPHPHPLVACRFIARTEAGDFVRPRRYPEPGEPLCEYLWCQRGIRGGDGAVLPSGLLTTRALLTQVPLRVGLPRLNDYDWYLRIGCIPGVHLEFPESGEPLAVYSCEGSRTRISSGADWRYCLSWIRSVRHLVTPRAYAAFTLTIASVTAARSRETKAFFVLLREACRGGRPRFGDLVAHAGIWLVSPGLRSRLAVAIEGRSTPGGKGSECRAEPRPGCVDGLPDGVRDVCRAILTGAAAAGLERLRAERGKRSFRAEIASGSAAGRYIIKELGPRGILDAVLLQRLRPVPGQRYPRSSEAIRAAGVPTPRVRFFVRHAKGPSYLLVMERIEGAQALGEVLRWLPAADRGALFRLIGQAVSRIHRDGIFHFDLNEDNLVFHESGGLLRGPWLVDLDLTVRASTRRAWLCRVLARLDMHQLFTIRFVETTDGDRRMFMLGYRDPDAPQQAITWNARPSAPPPPHRRYPWWKRYSGTGSIHLVRGGLLVCRLVR